MSRLDGKATRAWLGPDRTSCASASERPSTANLLAALLVSRLGRACLPTAIVGFFHGAVQPQASNSRSIELSGRHKVGRGISRRGPRPLDVARLTRAVGRDRHDDVGEAQALAALARIELRGIGGGSPRRGDQKVYRRRARGGRPKRAQTSLRACWRRTRARKRIAARTSSAASSARNSSGSTRSGRPIQMTS